MLMPSPTIGCASPAALPIEKPIRAGSMATDARAESARCRATCRRAGAVRRIPQRARVGAQVTLEASPAGCPGAATRQPERVTANAARKREPAVLAMTMPP